MLRADALVAIALVGSWLLPATLNAATPTYNKDVRPILVDTCFACHGPDSASRKADLRLDRFADATAMGAIVAGKPDDSQLIARILSTDPDEVMPPPSTKKKLTPEQIETLKQWIAAGAQYEQHWSLIPPKMPEVPQVEKPAFPLRNAIDHFILTSLNAAGLTPAPEADRRTLARRLSLDLTGLPPAPEAVEKFVADQSPDAYEKLVDSLLASPKWGEHRGRYWLDAARYGDTHGIHIDNFREMWTYRDWVINAFNNNMPFDQFTVEQLAGDLLPNRTYDQQIASGFNRCNITTNEGGAIAEEYAVLYNRDRTETTAQVWLGLTAGCSVCHDHKFDPLSQKEFYEMAAFFNNTTQNPMDGNIKDTPPIIVVPQDEELARWKELESEVPLAKNAVEARKKDGRPDFDTWLASAGQDIVDKMAPVAGLVAQAKLGEGEGKSLALKVGEEDKSLELTDKAKWQDGPPGEKALLLNGEAAQTPDIGDFEKDQPFSVAAWVKVASNDSSGALCARMDNGANFRGWDFWVQQRRIGMHIIDSWPGNALKVVSKAALPVDKWTHVVVTYDGSAKADGLKIYYNGKPQFVNVEQDKLTGSIKTQVPFKIGQRNSSDPIAAAGLHDLRIYNRVLESFEANSLGQADLLAKTLKKAPDKRTETEINGLYDWWLGAIDEVYQAAATKQGNLEREQAAIRGRGKIAHVMQEKTEPAMAFVLFRGEYDKRRDEVKPSTPAVLPKFPEDYSHDRLGFAKWLLLPEQPLPARVTVNRFWQELFGNGLVRTAGDFGITGELPSHPELLDWLALDFRNNGWDIKRFFKQVVMSSTYRQAAITTPEKIEKDRDNRLLSRGPRFRMDAEMIRDGALATSGLLSPKMGGPSVKPYQPDGVWEAVAMIGSNTRNYVRDTGESLYRRSLYTFWKRSAPPAQMEIFNAPSRETCVVRRERTNTPLQALVTLNDEQFVEAARRLAENTLKSGDTFDARLDYVTERLVSRPFENSERSIVRKVYDRLLDRYKADEESAKKLIAVGESKADAMLPVQDLAAWTMTINELMNLDEVLTK
jgi:mono/diheme cytochrome c family protein